MSDNTNREALELWIRSPEPCWSCGGEAEARDDIYVRCIDSKGINCEVMNHWFTRKTWNTRPRATVAAPQGDAVRTAVEEISSTFGLRFQEDSLHRAATIISRHLAVPVEQEFGDSFVAAVNAIKGISEDRRPAALAMLNNYFSAAVPVGEGDEDQCAWTLDDSNDGEVWETGCGEAFQFTDGGPTDNGFIFCYKCGKRIDAGKYSDFDSVGEEGK